MSARFCPHCGQPVVAGGTFCPSCGAALVGSAPVGAAPGFAPASNPWGPGATPPYPPGYGESGMPTPATRNADLSAMANVNLAAVLYLVGALLSFAVLFATPFYGFLGSYSTTVRGTGTAFALSLTWLYAILAFSIVGLVITFVELTLFRGAFRTLAAHDSRFSTPATLVVVLLVALVIVVVAAFGIFYLLYQALLCVGTGGTLTTSCFSAGSFLAILAVLGIAGIAALIGYIGLLIGIWRLGTRYDEGLFKVGAILVIFPILNLVGAILILVAVRSTRAKLGAGPSTPAFG